MPIFYLTEDEIPDQPKKDEVLSYSFVLRFRSAIERVTPAASATFPTTNFTETAPATISPYCYQIKDRHFFYTFSRLDIFLSAAVCISLNGMRPTALKNAVRTLLSLTTQSLYNINTHMSTLFLNFFQKKLPDIFISTYVYTNISKKTVLVYLNIIAI